MKITHEGFYAADNHPVMCGNVSTCHRIFLHSWQSSENVCGRIQGKAYEGYWLQGIVGGAFYFERILIFEKSVDSYVA